MDIYSNIAWNVFTQYINIVANTRYLPLLLSTDQGFKTPFIAKIYYFLSAVIQDGPSPV